MKSRARSTSRSRSRTSGRLKTSAGTKKLALVTAGAAALVVLGGSAPAKAMGLDARSDHGRISSWRWERGHDVPGNWPGRWRGWSNPGPVPTPSAIKPPVTTAPAIKPPIKPPVVKPPVIKPPVIKPTIPPGPTPPGPIPPGPTPPGGSTNRSGLPWKSGVYIGGSNPALVEAFAAWRGRPADVAVDWAARQTWDDVINPAWLYNAWKRTPYTKVFGIAPVPEGDPSATMANCAAGAYNGKWRQFGQNIQAAGLDNGTIIRLGWEFNGDWYKWRASDPAQFAGCWQQIVGSVRQTAPKLLWDWTVNRGAGQSVADARRAYPGDAYVDIVGVDSYDMWPAATTEAGWQKQYAGQYGLKFWADFAAAHDKKLSIPEWGVYPGPGGGGQDGGDNAFYIGKMTSFFRSQGTRLAYESYFNDKGTYYAGSLFGPVQNPSASAAYHRAIAP